MTQQRLKYLSQKAIEHNNGRGQCDFFSSKGHGWIRSQLTTDNNVNIWMNHNNTLQFTTEIYLIIAPKHARVLTFVTIDKNISTRKTARNLPIMCINKYGTSDIVSHFSPLPSMFE